MDPRLSRSHVTSFRLESDFPTVRWHPGVITGHIHCCIPSGLQLLPIENASRDATVHISGFKYSCSYENALNEVRDIYTSVYSLERSPAEPSIQLVPPTTPIRLHRFCTTDWHCFFMCAERPQPFTFLCTTVCNVMSNTSQLGPVRQPLV